MLNYNLKALVKSEPMARMTKNALEASITKGLQNYFCVSVVNLFERS